MICFLEGHKFSWSIRIPEQMKLLTFFFQKCVFDFGPGAMFFLFAGLNLFLIFEVSWSFKNPISLKIMIWVPIQKFGSNRKLVNNFNNYCLRIFGINAIKRTDFWKKNLSSTDDKNFSRILFLFLKSIWILFFERSEIQLVDSDP